MRSKYFYVALASCIILNLFPQKIYSCLNCDWENDSKGEFVTTSIGTLLNTALGNEMLNLLGEKGGKIDFNAAKTVNTPRVQAAFFPAGEKDGVRMGLLSVNLKDKGGFLFVIEEAVSINLMKSYVKLYTASGKIISLENFKLNINNGENAFQEKDDMSNSISISDLSGCDLLLIFCLVTYFNIIVCLVYILKCYF